MARGKEAEAMGLRDIKIANPSGRSFYDQRFVLAFGAYGDTYVLAYADSLESALDECVDWIAENAPGLLADNEVFAAYKEALAEAVAAGADPEDESVINTAQESATVDTTQAGNYGNYLHSWEWTIALENPTKATLIAFAKGG
jgi:hypothetical protein